MLSELDLGIVYFFKKQGPIYRPVEPREEGDVYRMLSSELEKPPKGGGPQEERRGAAILGKATGTGSGDSQAARSRRNTQRSMASSTTLMAKGQGSIEPGVEGRFAALRAGNS